MSLDFTVAIPVYNGAARVPAVLDHLRSQINPHGLNWEILVVDNNSSDGLADVIQAIQQTWTGQVPLRYCREGNQGLAYARDRAVKEAWGEWVGFLDDDNLPDPDWVTTAYDFGKAHPRAAAFGGQIRGRYEVAPPEEFNRIKSFLVIRQYARTAQLFQPERLQLPAGAGLVVRRDAWLVGIPSPLHCINRGGDDYEISLRLYRLGWEIWYCPDLKLTHCIPAWRMEQSYLTAIAYRYGLCTCELLMLITPPWRKPLVLARSFGGNLRRLLAHGLRYRMQGRSNLAIACEVSFFWGNIISPFFYLRNALRRGFTQMWPTQSARKNLSPIQNLP